jgi:exopolyphosphatase / guanosine-5'-triphosphate,3'-diphosphate pyrophosphatase
MRKKIAIIDMGTNTFHLLIAEDEKGQYRITHRERLAAKIGKGGINEGYITESGLNRALAAMHSFKQMIDKEGVGKTFAFGTSALRNASNKEEVLRKIKIETGIDAEIISGEVEAEYIYRGVRYSLDMGDEKSLIIDIGGGSVECIIGNNTQIFWKESFEIGAQRLLEKYQKNDPITKLEIATLDQHFEKALKTLFEALQKHKTSILIGASGTFDTLSDIFCYQRDIAMSDRQTETPLTLEAFYEIYQALISKNREQRLQIPGMIEMRVDMIVVACCLVRYILARHSFARLRVSTYSLKEGVLESLTQMSRGRLQN